MKRLGVIGLVIAIVGVLAISVTVIAATPAQADDGAKGTRTVELGLCNVYVIDNPLAPVSGDPIEYERGYVWSNGFESTWSPTGTLEVSRALTVPVDMPWIPILDQVIVGPSLKVTWEPAE